MHAVRPSPGMMLLSVVLRARTHPNKGTSTEVDKWVFHRSNSSIYMHFRVHDLLDH